MHLLVLNEGSQVPPTSILLLPAPAAEAEHRSGREQNAYSPLLSCLESAPGNGSAGLVARAESGLQKVLLLQGCVGEEPSLMLQSQAEPRSGPAGKTNTQLHPTLSYSRTAI